jgi:hypothetical protein
MKRQRCMYRYLYVTHRDILISHPVHYPFLLNRLSSISGSHEIENSTDLKSHLAMLRWY